MQFWNLSRKYKFWIIIRLYNNIKLDKIDMNLKVYQRYFFKSIFKNKDAIDKLSAIRKF